MGTDQAIAADDRAAQNHCIDTNQRVIADLRAMNQCLVTDRHVVADNDRRANIRV